MTILPPTDAPLQLLAGFAEFYPDRSLQMVVQTPGRAIWAALTTRSDETFGLASVELKTQTQFSYQSAKQVMTLLRRPLPRWARYAAGMLLLLREMGVEVSGFDAALIGDEGLGTRYEHALGLGFGAACCALRGRACTETMLLELAERARRNYVEN